MYKKKPQQQYALLQLTYKSSCKTYIIYGIYYLVQPPRLCSKKAETK